MGYWNSMEKDAKTMADETGGDPQALYGRWAGSQIESAIGNKIMEPDDRAKQRYKLAAAAGLVMPGLKDGELMMPLGFAKGGIVPKGKKCMANGGMVDQAIAQRARFEGKGGPREDQIPVKVAGQNINVSDGEEAMIIPAKTANNPAAMKAIMDIIRQTNDGREPGPQLEDGGMYKDGSSLRTYEPEPSARPFSSATPMEQRLATVANEVQAPTDVAKLRSIEPDVIPREAVRAPTAAPQTATPNRMGAVRTALNGNNATTLEGMAQGVKNVATQTGGKIAELGVKNAGRLANVARATAPAAGIEGAVRGLNTTTDEYYQRTGIDPVATVVPQVVKDTGVRALGVLSDVGASAINQLAAPVNLARHGLDTEKWYDYRNNFADVQAANAKPAPAPVQGIAAVRDTSTFPVTPKAAPVVAAPTVAPSIAQGVTTQPVAKKPSAQAQRQRFVRAPQPVQPVANQVEEAPDPSGLKMVAFGTNETQSIGGPRMFGNAFYANGVRELPANTGPNYEVGKVYNGRTLLSKQPDGTLAWLDKNSKTTIENPNNNKNFVVSPDGRNVSFANASQDMNRFTRRSAQADMAEVAQPVELVTAKGRAVFDPQNRNRLVPMDVYNTGRTQEYFDAQAQAAIDAQQNPDMAKIAGDIEQQKIAAGATLGAAGIHAGASRYDADKRLEAATRDNYGGQVGYVEDPNGGKTPVLLSWNKADGTPAPSPANAGLTDTVPTFQSKADLQQAIKAGKVKSGDLVNTPGGQIRVR